MGVIIMVSSGLKCLSVGLNHSSHILFVSRFKALAVSPGTVFPMVYRYIRYILMKMSILNIDLVAQC